jgi:non-ribosomal peptide synthetase component F
MRPGPATSIMDRMAVNPDRETLLEGIRALTAAPQPRLEEVERTLTDGYAHALQLEAEHLRLQRQLGQRAAELPDAPAADRVAEITGLARGVAEADGELNELRAALALLKETAQRIRTAA